MLLLNISELLGRSVSDELCRPGLKKPKDAKLAEVRVIYAAQSYVTRRSSLHVIISLRIQ